MDRDDVVKQAQEEARNLRSQLLNNAEGRFEETEGGWLVTLSRPIKVDGEERLRLKVRRAPDNPTVGDRYKARTAARKLTGGDKPEPEDLLMASVCLACGLAPGEFLQVAGADADLMLGLWLSSDPEIADPKA